MSHGKQETEGILYLMHLLRMSNNLRFVCAGEADVTDCNWSIRKGFTRCLIHCDTLVVNLLQSKQCAPRVYEQVN